MDDENVCELYTRHCEKYKNYLEKEIDDYLNKTYPLLRAYLTLKSDGSITQKMAELLKYVKAIEVHHHFGRHDVILNRCEKEKGNLIKDSNFAQLIKKYRIVLGLQETLHDPGNRIEAFHRKLDQERAELQKNRNSIVLKWLGLFGAALAGLVVFSYWTVKAAHAGLYNTKANVLLIKESDEIRSQLYRSPRKSMAQV